MTPQQRDTLLQALKLRFERHPHRHPGLAWADVQARLEGHPSTLRTLLQMESTGGEPDVVAPAGSTGPLTFFDCAAQSPLGRRSLCYDPEALASRKLQPPAGSAVGMAAEMGIELLTEAQYRQLQALEAFDTKTSSWLQTPVELRQLGGALFGDLRYGRVFTYHNGAASYYAARGFRGSVQV
jgi:hypothetical protein